MDWINGDKEREAFRQEPRVEEPAPAHVFPYTLFFLFLSLLTFWPFLNSGYCTSDDMWNALESYKGMFEAAKAQGRIHFMSLHGITVFGVHHIGEALGGHLMVNALALLSAVSNAVLLGYLLWLVSGSFHFSFFSSVVWVVTLQDSWSFFPLVASPVVYSLPFSFFLLALACQERFLRSGKTHWGWASAVFYFLALQYSEMFVCLLPVFPLLQARFGWAAFRVKHLLISLCPVVIFSTAYFGFRMVFPSGYAGNVFSGAFSASKVFSTLSAYVQPSIPTWQFFARSPFGSGHSFSELSVLCDGQPSLPFLLKTLANINAAILVKALAFSGLAVYVTRSMDRTSPVKMRWIVSLALLLMVLPNLPFAFNGKYQAWTSWLIGYTGTYYSTFGAALLSASAWCFMARLPAILSVPAIFITAFLVATATGIHNETMAQTKRQEGLKWELMDQWMKTPRFQAIENGAVIYAPSIFPRLNRFCIIPDEYWSRYVQARSGKCIRFIAQGAEFLKAAGSQPAHAYFLKYSTDSSGPHALLLFAPILDVRAEEETDGSLRVVGNEADLLFHPHRTRRILLFQDDTGDRALEVFSSSPAGTIKFHLQGKGICLNSVFAVSNPDALRFELQQTGKIPAVQEVYGPGFCNIEQNGFDRRAWAAGPDAELRLYNYSKRAIEAELSFQLAAGSRGGSVVTVQVDDARFRLSMPPPDSLLPVVLPVVIRSDGGCTAHFHCETNPGEQAAPGDSRPGVFGIFNPVVRKRTAPSSGSIQPAAQREWIAVGGDGKGFVCQPSRKTFTPWGFNYDHDFKSRLIEDYWESEWPTVEADFREMKALGANVVRVHLQFGRFMDGPDRPNARSLARLGKLVTLCEELGLYLDLTGLACYRKQDTPAWYDALDEPQRWRAQANFWRAVARECAGRNGVFAYDLMNEPAVPGERLAPGAWLYPTSLGGFYFVQRITLDAAGRDHSEVFRAWVRQLASAIREVDRRHLITVGLLPIAPGYAQAAAAEMDYVSVHIYPEKGKLDESLQTLQRFCVGKPVVIEETFPLSCGADELGAFIERSKKFASGWIGFYWGRTPEELRGSKQMADAMTLGWLELFQRINPSR